jgi:hypothetical protein
MKKVAHLPGAGIITVPRFSSRRKREWIRFAIGGKGFSVQSVFYKLALVLMLAQATVCASPVLDFPSGFATSGSTLNFNNAAQISGTRARIINGGFLQVGSVWSKNQVDIRKFNCQFTFQITQANEAGFTFAIQRADNTVSGYPYESLGYNAISPSLGLTFGPTLARPVFT